MTNLEFKQLRLKLGLTQLQLAQSLDLAGNSIARIERGELPLRKVVSMAVLYLEFCSKNDFQLSNIDDRLSDTYSEEQLTLPIEFAPTITVAKPIKISKEIDRILHVQSRKPVRKSPRKKKKGR
ncbi:helix-turn-helix domain-containing protein [Shewanella frigidimarina]|uniref:helix-turn-helix domain-containing protein n=1 Tax=Shewanella frigidimarina TaxID=56812 RepID=UPI003D7B07EB